MNLFCVESMYVCMTVFNRVCMVKSPLTKSWLECFFFCCFVFMIFLMSGLTATFVLAVYVSTSTGITFILKSMMPKCKNAVFPPLSPRSLSVLPFVPCWPSTAAFGPTVDHNRLIVWSA